MFLLNCITLFLSLDSKTSQQTKHSSPAIAKCSNYDERYMLCICAVQNVGGGGGEADKNAMANFIFSVPRFPLCSLFRRRSMWYN